MSSSTTGTSEPRSAGPPITGRAGADKLGLGLMLLLALIAAALAVTPVVAGSLQEVIGLSGAQVGFLASVFMLSFAVVSIPWGLVASRLGGRVLASGLFIAVIGYLVCAFSGGFGGLVTGRVIQGIGLGALVPTVGVIIPQAIVPRYVGRAWGIFGIGHGFGVLLVLLTLPSVAEAGGYRAVFLVMAGMVAVFGGIALLQAPVRRKPTRSAQTTQTVELLRALRTTITNRQVILLCIFNLACLSAGVGALVWTPQFMSTGFGAGVKVSAYLTAGLGLAQLVGNPLGALAMGIWSKRRVIAVSMLLMTVCIAVVPFLPRLWLVFVFVTAAGLFTMTMFSPMFAGAAEVVRTPAEVGAATGLLEVFGFAGALIAPWVFGAILDTVEGGRAYTLGYLLLAVIGALACVGLLFLRLPGRPVRPPSQEEAD